MSKVNWIVILITSIIVSGCAAEEKNHSAEEVPPAPVVAAPPPPPAPAPVLAAPSPASVPKTASHMPSAGAAGSGAAINYEKAAEVHTPARDFCINGENCGSGYAAYGFIIFTKRPTTDATKQRYISICKAFIGHLEPVSAYFNHIPKSQIATTFWLLSSKPKDEKSCDELITLYDYARATEVATSIKKLDSAGPLLVAWANFNTPKETTNKQLLIDLGRFTQNDLDSAFRIWRDKISQDQRFWGKGFNMNLILAEFKSFIEKYGEKIVQAIKPS